MATRKLSRMGIDSAVVQKLAARNILTPKDLLARTELDLVETIDLPVRQVQEIISCVSQSICPVPCTILHMLKRRQQESTHLMTSLQPVDKVLRGGVPTKGITELVGPAGVGKTQMCQMLSVIATLPSSAGGLGGKVIYIDTETKFSSMRLTQIARSRFPAHCQSAASMAQLSDQVLVLSPKNSEELDRQLRMLETTIIKHGVKLVVIDSIAALLRAEFSSHQLIQRQELLGQHAATLKFLSESFSIPVVVTNQVTTSFGRSAADASFEFEQRRSSRGAEAEDAGNVAAASESFLTAALGTKWAHCVNTRLVLEATASHRVLKVAKSPEAPFAAFAYLVTDRGLELTNQGSELLGASGGDASSVVGMAIRNEGPDVIGLAAMETTTRDAPEEAPSFASHSYGYNRGPDHYATGLAAPTGSNVNSRYVQRANYHAGASPYDPARGASTMTAPRDVGTTANAAQHADSNSARSLHGYSERGREGTSITAATVATRAVNATSTYTHTEGHSDREHNGTMREYDQDDVPTQH